MAPCDPYADPPVQPSVHDQLVSILDVEELQQTASASTAPKPRLAGLPREVLDHIASYITDRNDLAQLCKVNKLWFSVALSSLYHTFEIYIEGTLNPVRTQMFTRENAGLRFVREVIVHTEPTHPSKPDAAYQWLDIIANLIPQNSLSRFCWMTPHPLPARIFKLLWQRQRNLVRLEVVPQLVADSWNENGTEPNLEVELNRLEFPKLRSLRAITDTAQSASLTCAALPRGVITELEVDARLWQHGDAHQHEHSDEDADQDEDTSVHDILTGCMFGHLERAEPGRVPKHDFLTSLTLKDINLTLSKYTWFTDLDLCHLKHLRLEHCAGADIFLMQLASGAAAPGLRSFVLLHDLGAHADRTIHAIEDLLNFPRHKLHKLELCLRNVPKLPNAAAIRAHSRTLETLLLDISGKGDRRDSTIDPTRLGHWGQPSPSPSVASNDKSLVYDTDTFTSIIESCSSLRQLGVAFPTVGLKYDIFRCQPSVFPHWIDSLAMNLKLTTLNILNWPSNYKRGQNEGYYIAKNLQVARLAADIFLRHRMYDRDCKAFVKLERHPFLEVVAFGVRENGTESSSPAYFLQSEVTVQGKKHTDAQSVSLKDLKKHNLDIEVLDYEDRDFEETSRKNLGASAAWGTVGEEVNDEWQH
ncbi:hypothetical protein LTR37_019515 [Vermiconidia calcicola]|uniref:Uncharacterized protein n=1 Tax=Vermiconidia calcicola TaxID=1690605 RepID=A0ACC3MDT4_9PEZI|nr:hypothetical protein LTR37_019515 [Vermiconidia calcicola]